MVFTRSLTFLLVLVSLLLSSVHISNAGPSKVEVKAIVNEIQSALKASDSLIKTGRLQDLHAHSKKFNDTVAKSEKLFPVLDFANGYDCLKASINARLIWQTKMSYARSPDQYYADTIKKTTRQYNEDIAGCKEYAAKLKK